MCETCGIRNLPGELKVVALTANFKRWQTEGVSTDFIEEMIWEFGRHPEWARRARRPAWQVFLGRKQQLIALVGQARAKVGVSRERHNPEVWLATTRETQRHGRDRYLAAT